MVDEWLPRAGGNGALTDNGSRVSFKGNKHVLELDSHMVMCEQPVNILKTTQLWFKRVNCLVCQ